MPLSERIFAALACPSCGGGLEKVSSDGASCPACSVTYPQAGAGRPLDLRLRAPRRATVEFDLFAPPTPPEALRFEPLKPNAQPQIPDYEQIQIPPLLRSGNRLNRELLSYFPRSTTGGLMLDLGCGNKDFEPICRHTNLDYVGLDYDGESPDILGDAHALPFQDQTFDFVLSMAVLEHLRYPHVAMAEALRVLKPGGLFIGTVAFLEPFHMDSHAHLTHLGTYSVLKQAGFVVDAVAPNVEWSALHAMATMILFPRVPKRLADLLILPSWLLHRLWWKLGHLIDPKHRTSEAYRLPATTGGFRFVARRPARMLETRVNRQYIASAYPPRADREDTADAVHTDEDSRRAAG
jgi:SAM-dependent methyltransferase